MLGRLLGNLSAGEVSKAVVKASDLVEDDFTRKKVVVGVAIGGAILGTLWAIRSYQVWKRKKDDERLGVVDYLFDREEG